MRSDDDPDETPIDVPMQLVERRRVRSRPFAQPVDERDGIGRQARTAHLEHEDTDAPVEVHAEITGVRELRARADARMLAAGVSAEVRSAITPLIEVLAAHQRAGETRSANRDGQVLAARGGDDIGTRLDAIEGGLTEIHTELDDLRGLRPSRANGKLGTLRAEVKIIRGVLITIALAVLSGTVMAARALYAAGESQGTEAAEFDRLRQTVETLSERQDVIRLRLFGVIPAPAGSPGDPP